MPDETPFKPPVPFPPASGEAGPNADTSGRPLAPQPIAFNISEEFGTAKRNLPPVRILVVVLAVAAFLMGVFAFLARAKPQGGGSVDNVTAVEVPDQNLVLVAANITLRNTGEKPLWIRTIKMVLKTDAGELSDDAASAIDFERYFQAFPALKAGTIPAITPETKIPPGGNASGTVIAAFHVTKSAFDQRKSLSVVIQPYDQALPVTLTK